MIDSTLIQLLMFAWVFAPFSNDPFEGQETIREMERREVVIPEVSAPDANSDAALEYYRQYLSMPGGDPGMRMEAMRRMGDLNFKAGEDAQFANSGYADEMAHHNDAILLYEQLLQYQKDYSKADLVLYQLARAYESIGAPGKALATLDRLVADYPDSSYIDEAQFRRGEILFVYKDYHGAGLAYDVVVQIGDSSTYYQQSLYKRGWSLFKQAEYDDTVHSFLDLLNLRLAATEPEPELFLHEAEQFDTDQADISQMLMLEAITLEAKFDAMTRPERELVDDTLRVLSLTFAYMDGAATIDEYLVQRGGVDPACLLYTSLGDLYLEKERYFDAAETYDAFVASEPYHHNSPQLSMRSIEAYKAGRFPTMVLEGKRDFIEFYGLHSDYWAFHDHAERQDVIKPLKENLSDLAQYDHAEAQRTGEPEAYARAADWYRRYLDYFPNDQDSAQRSFLLGEVLMESGQFAKASHYYQRAAYDYTGYEQASESGYAALLASGAHHSTLSGDAADAWLVLQLRQALTFVQSFPEHEQAAPVLSDTAEAYYAAKEMDEAIVVAGELLATESSVAPGLQQVAWTVVAHGHFDLEHYHRAEIAYLQLRAMGTTGGMTVAELDERIAASVYRQAEAAQVAGNIDKAVTDYLRVEVVTPASSIASNAKYDAAILLFNEARWRESIVVMTGFRVTYPEHEFADAITQNLAVAYQRSDQPVRAAAELERIAVMADVDDEMRREALWNSAELYEAARHIENARRLWRQFVTEFPQPLAESIEARQRLADLAGVAGDARDRRDWLTVIISVDAAAGSQRSDRTKTLAANASIELADPKRMAFNAVRLNIPLAENLKKKRQLMESALDAYGKAAGYGIADVKTVATFRIAELYHQLSIDLMDSERPDGLSMDELEQYEILLEEQAFPFEEKAIELFEVNATRASAGVYDEWVASSYARLAILMPARYAKFEKTESQLAQLY